VRCCDSKLLIPRGAKSNTASERISVSCEIAAVSASWAWRNVNAARKRSVCLIGKAELIFFQIIKVKISKFVFVKVCKDKNRNVMDRTATIQTQSFNGMKYSTFDVICTISKS